MVLVLAVATSAVAVGPSAATQSVWVNVDPGDLEHGDAEQSMEVLVEGATESTEFTVNVTSLADAGVDLSDAAVSVDEPPGAAVDAALVRSGDDVLVRVSVDPEDGTAPADVEFGMTLTGLDTANASHARLDYGVTYEGGQRTTPTFELRNPDLPWVSPLTRSEYLVTGERNASQHTRVTLDDVPAADEATVRIDISALTARNVSLSTATVEARLVEPDEGASLRRVELDGSTVELSIRTETETDVTVELALRGLDTRGAEPADDLRYVIAFEGPAGTMSGTSQPFGLYAPGDTPTATPPPTTAPPTRGPPGGTATATESPTSGPTTTPTASPPAGAGTSSTGDTTDGEGPGFGVLVALLSLLVVAPLARGRLR